MDAEPVRETDVFDLAERVRVSPRAAAGGAAQSISVLA
jgi:hypothetical protein